VQLAKDGHAKVMALEADLKKAKDALQVRRRPTATWHRAGAAHHSRPPHP